jgi:hypothetical protein
MRAHPAAELELTCSLLPDPVETGLGTELLVTGHLRPPPGTRAVDLLVERQSRRALVAPDPDDRGKLRFWALAGFAPPPRPTLTRLALRAGGAGGAGGIRQGELGTPLVLERRGDLGGPTATAGAAPEGGPGEPTAICMATHEPDRARLAAQIESIRAQTHRNWVCVISDDASSPAALAAVRAEIGEDRRFVLVRAPRRLGAAQNFAHALRQAPPWATVIALADQDDRWHPGKLAALASEVAAGASLAVADMRIVDEHGAVLSETFWTHRRPCFDDLGTLLITNSVTGAACAFDAALLERILPMPVTPGALFHDHWIGLVALASGRIVHVPRPLHDYVQHGGNMIGHDERHVRRANLPRSWDAAARAHDDDLLRIELLARVLLRRCAGMEPAKHAALAPFAAQSLRALRSAVTLRSLRGAADPTAGGGLRIASALLWRRVACAG